MNTEKSAVLVGGISYDREKIIVFDIETTGFDFEKDDILQMSIVDGNGKTLLNEYFSPVHREQWEEAEAVNHISPAMVADKPKLEEFVPIIQSIVEAADLVVGYNQIGFDCPFIEAATGISFERKEMVDVMLEFAPIYGEWNDYYNDYKWKSLSVCASHYHYEFKPHNSLEDTLATLHCFNCITSLQRSFSIYQMKRNCLTQHYRFMPLQFLQQNNTDPNIEMYDKVYTAKLENKTLEDIYMEFNIHHPQDFLGHSLSVSDVIAIENPDRTITAYYVDSVGFQELPSLSAEIYNETIYEAQAAQLAKTLVEFLYGCDSRSLSAEQEYTLIQLQGDVLSGDVESIEQMLLSACKEENPDALSLLEQLRYFTNTTEEKINQPETEQSEDLEL